MSRKMEESRDDEQFHDSGDCERSFHFGAPVKGK